jgi:hypothetical protein
MNASKIIGFGLCVNVILSWVPAVAQGTFRNMDFELANLSGHSPGDTTVPTSAAFPFWTAFFGTNIISTVRYDTFSFSGGDIAIIDRVGFGGFSSIDGNYSAFLLGAGAGYPPYAPTTLSQTGLVPAGTLSLLVKMHFANAASDPVVSLGGQTLNMIPLQAFPNYTLYGASISSFAGQVAALSVSAPAAVGPQSLLLLDDITFSPIAVPEPTTKALLGAAGLVVAFRLLRQRG